MFSSRIISLLSLHFIAMGNATTHAHTTQREITILTFVLWNEQCVGGFFYHWDYLSEYVCIKKRIDVVQRIQCSMNRNNKHHISPLWNSKQQTEWDYIIFDKNHHRLSRSVHLHRITFRFSGCSKPYLKWSVFRDYLNYCFYLKYYLVFYSIENLTGARWNGHGRWYDWLNSTVWNDFISCRCVSQMKQYSIRFE